jgi:Xaa-Pro aminopeptidase
MPHHQLESLKKEVPKRIEALRSLMVEEKIEAALILQRVDLFYFTATAQEGALYVDEKEELFFVKKYAPRAREESPLEAIEISSLKEIPSFLRKKPKLLGLELDVVPVELFFSLQQIFPEAKFQNISPLTLRLRMVKSPSEIELIKEAAQIASFALEKVPHILREGMSELELAGELLRLIMPKGHQEYIRMRGFNREAHSWHVLSGESGTVLSHIDAPMGGFGPSVAYPMGASLKPIRKNEVVLVDLSTCFWGYHSDQTRCFSIGKLPEPLKRGYEVSTKIINLLAKEARPGFSAEWFYKKARSLAEEEGLGDYFLGPKPYQTKFVGHGIGLEISEPPFLALGHDYPIHEGMTLSIEPKMVFPELGAVGIENTYVVTSEGLLPLTSAQEELIEVGG